MQMLVEVFMMRAPVKERLDCRSDVMTQPLPGHYTACNLCLLAEPH
jgi:hypothetical protein